MLQNAVNARKIQSICPRRRECKPSEGIGDQAEIERFLKTGFRESVFEVAVAFSNRRRIGGVEQEWRSPPSLRAFFVFLKYAAETEKHHDKRTHENNYDDQSVD